jgi:molybdopterin-binding protein
MELVRIKQAADALGVSYPTIKQWIYHRKIRSIQTAGGHHRIPRTEIDRLLFTGTADKPKGSRGRRLKRVGPTTSMVNPLTGFEHLISGRNQLVGRVTGVKSMGLLAKISLDVGGQIITSIITQDACRDLHLKVGDTAAALIKATEVMIIRPASRQN